MVSHDLGPAASVEGVASLQDNETVPEVDAQIQRLMTGESGNRPCHRHLILLAQR